MTATYRQPELRARPSATDYGWELVDRRGTIQAEHLDEQCARWISEATELFELTTSQELVDCAMAACDAGVLPDADPPSANADQRSEQPDAHKEAAE